jgi:hypothetical protein
LWIIFVLSLLKGRRHRAGTAAASKKAGRETLMEDRGP